MTSPMARGRWRLLRGGTGWSAEGRWLSVLGDGIWHFFREEGPEDARGTAEHFWNWKKKDGLLVFSPGFSEF